MVLKVLQGKDFFSHEKHILDMADQEAQQRKRNVDYTYQSSPRKIFALSKLNCNAVFYDRMEY